MSPTEAQALAPKQNEDAQTTQEDPAVTSTNEDGVTPKPYHVAPLTPEKASLVDQGKKYTVVAWDLDSTGRRLVDEICHVGDMSTTYLTGLSTKFFFFSRSVLTMWIRRERVIRILST